MGGQRCGGVLAAEFVDAMGGLVCRMVVIESRHCHCHDVESPAQPKLPRGGRRSRWGVVLTHLHQKGRHCDWLWETRARVDDEERESRAWSGNPSTQWSRSVHRNKEERIVGTGNADADEAVVNMLQRYEFGAIF